MALLCRIESVAVIGAGPTGLAVSRRLLEAGFSVTVFEKRRHIGGIWFYEDASTGGPSGDLTPHLGGFPGHLGQTLLPSPCYNSLKTNLITPIMTFGGFPHPEGTDWFVPHHHVLQYLEDFSRKFEIDKRTRCNAFVRRVHKSASNTWIITVDYAKGDTGTGSATKVDTVEEKFQAVVVCNGHYDKPDITNTPGVNEWMSVWPRRVFHSSGGVVRLTDEKVVLVIGSGVSAFDLGKEIALVAKKVIQAKREALRDDRGADEKLVEQFTRSTLPENMTQVPEVVQFCSPAKSPNIADAKVLLANGELLTGIDHVVLCTGYLYSTPFLNNSSAESPQGRGSACPKIVTDGSQMHNLHLDMFYIPDPTLAFVGVPQYITTFRLFDFQSTAIAAVFAGKALLPTRREMQSAYARRKEAPGSPKDFHSLGSRKEVLYIRDIAHWINTPGILSLAETYEELILYTRSHAVEICRKRLVDTAVFEEREKAEFETLVDRKMAILAQELARIPV